MERKYMMYEGEDVNKIDLLYEEPTDKANGVKIIVPIKNYDIAQFCSKIKTQLAYFEGVYFRVGGISNDFKIMRHELFQYSPLNTDTHIHICLDNVYYPIDYSKIAYNDLSNYSIPIALRFSLTDGIFPTPNRESIRYTKEAITAIEKRLAQVADYFVEQYNNTVKNTDDVLSIIDYHRNGYRYIDGYDNTKWEITKFSKISSKKVIEPKLTIVKKMTSYMVYSVHKNLFQDYVTRMHYSVGNQRFVQCKNTWDQTVNFDNIIRKENKIYVYNEKMSPLKRAYIKEQVDEKIGINKCIFLRKEKEFYLGSKKDNNHLSYYYTLGLKNHQKSDWRALIEDFNTIKNYFVKQFVDVDKIVIPKHWLDSRKKARVELMKARGTDKRYVKVTGEVTLRMQTSLNKVMMGRYAKVTPIIVNLAEQYKNKYLTVYGTTEDISLTEKLFSIFNKDKIKFGVLSAKEYDKVKNVEIRNWMSLSKFMEGDNKPFRRAVTAYKIHELINEYLNSFNSLEVIRKVCSTLAEDMTELYDYKRENFINGEVELYEIMTKTTDDKGLYDYSIYSNYLKIKKTLSKLRFIERLCSLSARTSYYYANKHEDTIPLMVDLFKYHKQKVNIEHYVLNKDAENTETVTEADVEQLVNETI